MELDEAVGFVKDCIHDAAAPCGCVCPFHLDLRSFMKKTARGRFPAAYREMRTAVVFPTVVAALCPRPCMEKCQRSLLGDEPPQIAALENAVIRLAGAQTPDVFPVPAKETAVAVVGAGPAGLALALSMAQKKYPVTVFEAAEAWGGALRTHPDFAVFDADFAAQFSAENVDFRFNTRVESLDELESFSAIYVATGQGGADFGLLEKWDADTLYAGGRVFLGGALCGLPLMESIAAGAAVSRAMESVIQTGKTLQKEENKVCVSCSLVPEGAESAARIVPADAQAGYTKDEAKAEAARCFQCNCSACLEQCELLQSYRKAPSQMAMEVLADSSPHFLSGRTMTRETYSCNQCGYCKSICPSAVDLGALFRFSREARTEDGIQPAALHEFWLNELDFSGGEGFYASGGKCESVFFPGCQLTALMPKHVLDTWAFLRTRMDVGILLGCCGAPAVWAGDKQRKTENLAKLRAALETMGSPKVIAACASCAKMLREQLPEIEVVSLYETLAALDAPHAALPFSDAAVFDPCAARDETTVHESVMQLAEQSGCRAEALADGGKCCGYGGHIRLANPALYRKITDNRAAESEKPYIVYCANCLEVFRARGKTCAHILDAVFGASDAAAPTLSEKRQNVLYVKDKLMKELENKNFTPQAQPWDGVTLTLSDAVRADMEEKLILDEDVKELIFRAEQEKAYFLDEDGLHCASLIRPVIVYWAEYRALGENRYELVSAYCHRMHFGGEADA